MRVSGPTVCVAALVLCGLTSVYGAERTFHGEGYTFTYPSTWNLNREPQTNIISLKSQFDFQPEIRILESPLLSTDPNTAHQIALAGIRKNLGDQAQFYLHTVLLRDKMLIILAQAAPGDSTGPIVQALAASVRMLPVSAVEVKSRSDGPEFRRLPSTVFNPNRFLSEALQSQTAMDNLLRNYYGFRRVVSVQDFSAQGASGGTRELAWRVIRRKGEPYRKILYSSNSSMTFLEMTNEDQWDMWNVHPFVLTAKLAGKYNITYDGSADFHDRLTHRFHVIPKKVLTGERYFEGFIYIDDVDAETVQIEGKGVGYAPAVRGKEQCFPQFQTFFEKQAEVEHHWVPIRSLTVDETCNDARVRVSMTWSEYQDLRREDVSSSIQFGGYEKVEEGVKPQP